MGETTAGAQGSRRLIIGTELGAFIPVCSLSREKYRLLLI